MSTTRDINMQEMAHCAQLSPGGSHIRYHGGQPFLYENGAFRLFSGVMPASVLQHCREYAEIGAGCQRRLGMGPVPREEAEIPSGRDSVARSITNESPIDAPAELAASGVGVYEAPRGIKRMRHLLFPPDGECADLPLDLDETGVIYAPIELSLDMWRGEKGRTIKYAGRRRRLIFSPRSRNRWRTYRLLRLWADRRLPATIFSHTQVKPSPPAASGK